MSDVLSAWLDELRDLSALVLAELVRRLGASERDVDYQAAYGRMAGLIELFRPDRHPGRFYFRDPRQRSVLVYVHFRPAPAWITPDALAQQFGPPDRRLASRAGKAFTQNVCAARGFAYAASANEVAFIECFEPTTVASYLDRIHDAPGSRIL